MKNNRYFFPVVKGSFDAASRSPEAQKHFAGADKLSADAALTPSVRQTIISRVRYETVNNPLLDGIVQTIADDTIGTGPRLQLTAMDARADRDALFRREERFFRWTEEINLSEKLRLARITKTRDGEVFLRLVRNPKLQNIVKIDIVLYESEQIGSDLAAEYTKYDKNGNPKEYDGLIFDKYGNVSSYRFWKNHPGDLGIGLVAYKTFIVPAAEVIHYAHIMRPGQHRGLSELASALNVFNDLHRYSNSVLAAAETAAQISFLLHTDAMPDAEDSEGQEIRFMDVVELARNAGLALPEGWKASQMKAEQPVGSYADFNDAKIAEAARAISMPFAIAKGDSSKSNYASSRQDHKMYHKKILTERKRIDRTILNRLLAIFESIDAIAFPEDYRFPVKVSWFWDGFEHVDPVKEANAQAIRLASHTTTLADECAKDGKDYETVLHQIAAEKKLKKDLGIAEDPVSTKENEEDAE